MSSVKIYKLRQILLSRNLVPVREFLDQKILNVAVNLTKIAAVDALAVSQSILNFVGSLS